MAPPSTPEEVDINGSHLRSVPAITSQRQDAVKLHGDFSPRWKTLDCSSRLWVHRALGGDSGEVVDPFMHVGTYPTRHLATLRESELLPAFSGPWLG